MSMVSRLVENKDLLETVFGPRDNVMHYGPQEVKWVMAFLGDTDRFRAKFNKAYSELK